MTRTPTIASVNAKRGRQAERDDVFARAQSKAFTLDGVPARVIGRLLDFPRVVTESGMRAEINWTQLAAMVDRDGVINVTS